MAPGLSPFPLLQAQDLDYRARPADLVACHPPAGEGLLILESALELATSHYCLHQAGGQ